MRGSAHISFFSSSNLSLIFGLNPKYGVTFLLQVPFIAELELSLYWHEGSLTGSAIAVMMAWLSLRLVINSGGVLFGLGKFNTGPGLKDWIFGQKKEELVVHDDSKRHVKEVVINDVTYIYQTADNYVYRTRSKKKHLNGVYWYCVESGQRIPFVSPDDNIYYKVLKAIRAIEKFKRDIANGN